MDIEVLRWFHQVAEGMTVTEIADMEMVSQPGVSRALARLERELGTPLLHRHGRRLRPTRAGGVFKQYVDRVLVSYDDGLAAVSELADPETGTVTVAFQTSLGSWLVPALIRLFREDHPQVRFRLEESDDSPDSPRVASGRVDLEVTARIPRNEQVHWEHLFSQPLALTVPADHRLAWRRKVRMAEVADEDFVMFAPSWALRTLTDRLCAAAGFTPRVAFEADDFSVIRGFVTSGLGVAVLPATEPGGRRRGSRSQPLITLTDDGAHRDVGLSWSTTRRLLPSAELFRDFVLGPGLRRLDAVG